VRGEAQLGPGWRTGFPRRNRRRQEDTGQIPANTLVHVNCQLAQHQKASLTTHVVHVQ